MDPKIADQDGFTALICAALLGHAPVVTLLLADERVDPNMADQDGATALMAAADKGNASVVTLLQRRCACRRARGPQHCRRGWRHGTKG